MSAQVFDVAVSVDGWPENAVPAGIAPGSIALAPG
jgi:hypothetical protein